MKDRSVLVGLSGGINSMAVLLWLMDQPEQPRTVHLYYAHFRQHSADTWSFVRAGIEMARAHFADVRVRVTRNDVLQYFRDQNMIPHPMNSPCSKNLKILPMQRYRVEHGIDVDLVGFVKEERTRIERAAKYGAGSLYPIAQFTDQWCLDLCRERIGWVPAIYDIQRNGRRVFRHNNCLPCKNMTTDQLKDVAEHFPKEHAEAMELAADLGKYWGRDRDAFYSTFGRDLGQPSTCSACEW